VKRQYINEAIKGLIGLGIKGVNITSPYKEVSAANLDNHNETNGVVNTLKFLDSKIFGYNTDYFGITKTFENNMVDLKNKKVLLIGAGGVAKTIYKFLIDNNISNVVNLNRNIEKIQNSIKTFTKKRILCNCAELNSEKFNNYIKNADILINATSCDLLSGIIEIDFESLEKRDITFFDVLYNPRTCLIREALKHNIKAFDGLEMLIFQAFKSFEIWTGIYPEKEHFEKMYKMLNDNK
jgi:shikimate dehydrogenase